MAINIPIISDFTDKGIKDAKVAFNKFKTEVADADGVMGKFRVASSNALDYVKQNAKVFAVGAAGAITAFATKSVMAFQELALQAGKFADATGLAVDDASRWIEVAGDIGIEAGTIESAIGRMNKTLGGSPDKFRELGVEVVRVSSGAVDANKTFLNVIDRLNGIKDPAEKAKVATQLLGKGWQSMAELIGQGSTALTKSLKEVDDSKVVDTKELQNAREFRDALEELKDRSSELALSIGGGLVPVLTKLVSGVIAVKDFIRDGADGITHYANELTDLVGLTSNEWLDVAGQEIAVLKKNADTRSAANRALIDAYNATHNLTYAEEEHIQAVWALTDAWQTLLGTLDLQASFRNAEDAIRDMNQAAIEAFGNPAALNAYKDQQDSVIRKFAEIMSAMRLTSDEQNRIKFLVDTAPLEYALEALRKLDLAKTGQISTNLTRTGARAGGGPVMGGAPYLVGENGPEIFVPGSSGTIANSTATNVTVNVSGADPNAVVRALQQYVRQSGPVPVNTRTM